MVIKKAVVFMAMEHSGRSTPAECRGSRHRPPCGRPWGTEEDRRRRSPGPYPRYDLSVLPEPRRRQKSSDRRPATGRWRTSMWSGADGRSPAEGAAEGSGAKGGQNHDRYGSVGFAGRHLAGFLSGERGDCPPLFLLGSAGLVRQVSAWGDAAASHFSDRPRW
jgi:hypothetical protein